ncbi:MAG: hypothetical protein ACR2MB_15545 [Acidimicrobiales bacterium]
MLIAQVWHFWISLPLVFGAVVFGVVTVIGYLNKVVRPKYPRRGQS